MCVRTLWLSFQHPQIWELIQNNIIFYWYSDYKTKTSFTVTVAFVTENGRVQEFSVSLDKVGVSESQISADCKAKNIPCEVNERTCLTCWAAFCKLSSGSLLLLRKSRSLFSLGGASFLRCGLGAWYSILWKTLRYNERLSPVWITAYWQTVTYK